MLGFFKELRKMYSGRGVVSIYCWLVLAASLSVACFVQQANADVTIGGNMDVSPSNPAGWTDGSSGTSAIIGDDNTSGAATLTIVGFCNLRTKNAIIGNDEDVNGVVIVDGTNATWINRVFNDDDDYLYVGNYGNGTLNITDGGEVTLVYRLYIAYETGSTGVIVVDGEDSKLYINSVQGNFFSVGHKGIGSLIVSDGGEAEVAKCSIGTLANSEGKVTVTGTNSKLTTTDFKIGEAGYGELKILKDGLVKVISAFHLDVDEGDNGFINMAKGGQLAIPGNKEADLETFFGGVAGTDEIRYWTGSDWVVLDDTSTPATEVDDPEDIDEDKKFSLVYHTSGDLYGYTVLTVGYSYHYRLPGDANLDGVVSAGDYASIQANYGNTGDWDLPGDANMDGVVSAGDYASVQANFGNTEAE